ECHIVVTSAWPRMRLAIGSSAVLSNHAGPLLQPCKQGHDPLQMPRVTPANRAGHSARQGKPPMNKAAPPRRSALLLVDFINFFDFDGGQQLGRRARKAAAATAGLKARLQRQGMPCIYINDNY